MYESTKTKLAWRIYNECVKRGTDLNYSDVLGIINDEFSGKIFLIWSVIDIAIYANTRYEYAISRKGCQEILDLALRKFNSTIGLNWDILGGCIEDHEEKRKLTDKEIDLTIDGKIVYMDD